MNNDNIVNSIPSIDQDLKKKQDLEKQQQQQQPKKNKNKSKTETKEDGELDDEDQITHEDLNDNTNFDFNSYDYDDDDDDEFNNKRLRIDESENVNNNNNNNNNNIQTNGQQQTHQTTDSQKNDADMNKTELNDISSQSSSISLLTEVSTSSNSSIKQNESEPNHKQSQKQKNLKVPPLKICSNPNGGFKCLINNDEQHQAQQQQQQQQQANNDQINTRSKNLQNKSRVSSPINFRTTPTRRNNNHNNVGRSSPSIQTEGSSFGPDGLRRKLRSHTRQLQSGDNTNNQKSPSESPQTVSGDTEEAESINQQKTEEQAQHVEEPSQVGRKKGKQQMKISQELNEAENNILNTNQAETDSIMQKQLEANQESLINCIRKYLDLRQHLIKKRDLLKRYNSQELKKPKNFSEFVLNKKNYLIKKNSEIRQSIPFYKPPSDLCEDLKEYFIKQEKERYRLRLRHRVEQDKLIILYEQEVLRCFNKLALDELNQELPFSFCTIIKDDEVYSEYKNDVNFNQNINHANNENNYDKFLNSLNQIKIKFLNLKDDMIKRQLNESDSLYAVQKMDFQSKARDLCTLNKPNQQSIDVQVPIVHVNNKFELLDALN